MPIAESRVLKPREGGVEDSNDWPSFSLVDASVVSQATGLPCSLLSAHKDNRVTVVGRLNEVGDESRVLDPKCRQRIIQLQNVTTYSFAEYGDGTYGFWAAGEAGWFELEEMVPQYKPIIDEMNVATSMLYFVADRMRRSRKTQFTKAEFDKHIHRLFQDVTNRQAAERSAR